MKDQIEEAIDSLLEKGVSGDIQQARAIIINLFNKHGLQCWKKFYSAIGKDKPPKVKFWGADIEGKKAERFIGDLNMLPFVTDIVNSPGLSTTMPPSITVYFDPDLV